MTYEFAIIEKKEHLWIITLNRPERMNALHSPAHKELDEIFNNFEIFILEVSMCENDISNNQANF